MSDTSNPGNLASAAEFDGRLKRTDENRWLATRYAPPEARERLVAIYLLHQELSRALHTKEAMLGKIRIQWWRETVEQIETKVAQMTGTTVPFFTREVPKEVLKKVVPLLIGQVEKQ